MILFSFPDYDASYICCLEFGDFFLMQNCSTQKGIMGDSCTITLIHAALCIFSSCLNICKNYCHSVMYVVHWSWGIMTDENYIWGKKKRSWAQWSSGIFPAQTALWFYGCVETLGNWEKQEKLCRKNFRLSRFPVSEPLCEGIKKRWRIYLMFE